MTTTNQSPPGGCCCGAGWTETVSDAQIVDVFERVRDIPFSFAPHTDAGTLLRHGSGTCAPKHALLAQEYARLGVPTRFVYVTYRLDDMPGAFPPELRPLVYDGIVRGHAALQIFRSSGWVDAAGRRPAEPCGDG